MARYTSKQTTVVLQDGAALDVTLGPGEGNFTIDNLMEDNSEFIPVMNRGTFDGGVEGDDVFQSWSITLQVKNEALTHATNDRVLDAIRKTGAWASATTTAPAGTTKHLVKIVVTMNDGTTTTTITLPCNRVTASFAEGKEGHTWSLSGTNYQAPTYA